MGYEAKCNCRHCGGELAFLSDSEGQSVECPHCKLETRLYAPPLEELLPPMVPAPPLAEVALTPGTKHRKF